MLSFPQWLLSNRLPSGPVCLPETDFPLRSFHLFVDVGFAVEWVMSLREWLFSWVLAVLLDFTWRHNSYNPAAGKQWPPQSPAAPLHAFLSRATLTGFALHTLKKKKILLRVLCWFLKCLWEEFYLNGHKYFYYSPRSKLMLRFCAHL